MASDTASTPGTARAADYAARVEKRRATLAARKAGAGAPQPKAAGRPPQRAALRPGQALGRDGEIINRRRTFGDHAHVNEFDLDERDRDPNWQRYAVRTSVYGKPDPTPYNDAYASGYRPVLKKHVPNSFSDLTNPDQPIERDGLILMERPIQFAHEALAEQHGEALRLRQTQMESFGKRKLKKGLKPGGVSGDGAYDASRKVERQGYEAAVGNAYQPTLQRSQPGDDE